MHSVQSRSTTYLVAARAFGRKLLLVARHTIAFLVFRYEAFRADRLRADIASEAMLVKLLSAILELLAACKQTLPVVIEVMQEPAARSPGLNI